MERLRGRSKRFVVSLLRRLGVEWDAKWLYYRTYATLAKPDDTLTVGRASARFLDAGSVPEYVRTIVEIEREVVDDLLEAVRPGDVFYDVGAGFGTYACLVGGLLDGGEVIAFEPNVSRFPFLERHLRINGVPGRALTGALSDREQRIPHAGGDLRTRPGDDMVAYGEIPPATVVKIDVEGLELAVVNGLRETLERPACRLVFCELHPDDLPGTRQHGQLSRRDVDDLVHVLKSCGFDVRRVEPSEGPPFLRAEKG